jgi:galactonate dehydratase
MLMRIAQIEDLHCDAGWRVWSFLKVTTDDGVVGWSEYNESYGSQGLSAVIQKLAERLIGLDPRPVERITAMLHALTRQAPGGLIQQAIAAIENALVDVKARALGVPVAELLNGPVRDRLRLYWSHCGSYRVSHADAMGKPPVRSLDDLRALARTVKEEGFSALKTNIFCFDRGAPYMHQPGFARNAGWPELNGCCASSAMRWRHSARARATRSTCCWISTSTLRPRAISRSPARSSPTASCGWRSTPTIRKHSP